MAINHVEARRVLFYHCRGLPDLHDENSNCGDSCDIVIIVLSDIIREPPKRKETAPSDSPGFNSCEEREFA